MNGCRIISGLLVLASGASFLGLAYGVLDAKTTYTVAGLALGIFGLHKLLACMGICQCCKEEQCCKDEKCCK
ncbi:MAG: hypothetical protein AABW86_02210 [Candidatus Micrarchaeota archaeon]